MAPLFPFNILVALLAVLSFMLAQVDLKHGNATLTPILAESTSPSSA